jgi:ribose/xylose/arabinose/galactoside ABC-type transport system permease subunit
MTAPAPLSARGVSLVDILERWAIWLVLLTLLLLAAMLTDAFTRPSYLFGILRQAAPVGIAAVGVTVVMIMRGIDLSVGAVISLTAVTAAILMDGSAANLPLALAVTLAAGAAIGLVNGTIVTLTRASPFIVTLGMALVILGVTQIFSGGTARGVVAPGFREAFNYRIGDLVPVIAVVFVVVAAVFALVLRHTVFGRMVYLIGSNPFAARLAGLPVAKVTLAAYALSGLLAAFAGIMLLARTGVSGTLAGRGYEFDVLAAVVLGGTAFEGGRGTIGGTVAGVLVLILAFNLVNILGLSFHVQLMIKGAIIILVSAAYAALRARA